MNKYVKIGLGVLAFFILLGIAGRMDYNEQVIYNMPGSVYLLIKAKVGDSDSKIVKEYLKNKEYYERIEKTH